MKKLDKETANRLINNIVKITNCGECGNFHNDVTDFNYCVDCKQFWGMIEETYLHNAQFVITKA